MMLALLVIALTIVALAMAVHAVIQDMKERER